MVLQIYWWGWFIPELLEKFAGHKLTIKSTLKQSQTGGSLGDISFTVNAHVHLWVSFHVIMTNNDNNMPNNIQVDRYCI